MPSTSVPLSDLPPSWAQALEAMERALAQRLAAAPEPPEPVTGEGPAWLSTLGRLQEHLAWLEAFAERAARGAAEVDALLAAGADDLRAWLDAAAATRQRLADGTAHPV